MNLKVIAYVLSRLQFFVTFSMGVPFVMALLWGEDCAMDFAGTILVSLGVSVYSLSTRVPVLSSPILKLKAAPSRSLALTERKQAI